MVSVFTISGFPGKMSALFWGDRVIFHDPCFVGGNGGFLETWKICGSLGLFWMVVDFC